MKKLVLILFFPFLFLSSCSKDDDDVVSKIYTDENPLELYLQNSGYNQYTIPAIGSRYVETGFKFQTKVKGRLKAVTLKIPLTRKNVPITIWNADTQEVIKTIIILNTKANVEVVTEIEPIIIDPSKKYIISFNDVSGYSRARNDFTPAHYPVKAGNVMVLASQYSSWGTNYPSLPNFPNEISSVYYYGDISFVFQQID